MKMNNVEDLLREYKGEVNVAVWSFYAWKHIGDLAAKDGDILEALNTNAQTWNTITHSLITTFYTSIGRIFDGDKRSLTVRSFVKQCQDNTDQFSKAALEARRLENEHGGRPDYLDDYLKNAYEPTSADFEALSKAISAYEKVYRDRYEPIRHKIIAHKDLATIGSKDSLFARTDIGEVEAILQFLDGVGEVVRQLYTDGRMTCLTDHVLTEGRFVCKDLGDLLRKLVERNGPPYG